MGRPRAATWALGRAALCIGFPTAEPVARSLPQGFHYWASCPDSNDSRAVTLLHGPARCAGLLVTKAETKKNLAVCLEKGSARRTKESTGRQLRSFGKRKALPCQRLRAVQVQPAIVIGPPQSNVYNLLPIGASPTTVEEELTASSSSRINWSTYYN